MLTTADYPSAITSNPALLPNSISYPSSVDSDFAGRAIQLEELDGRLKMMLKLKLREFIHLSPFFQDIPSIDLSFYKALPQARPLMVDNSGACPNRPQHFVQAKRRALRHSLV